MKLIYRLFNILIVAAIAFGCNQADEKSSKVSEIDLARNRVEVIDFYSTHRCETCLSIESNAQYTVDTFFEDQKDDGLVLFKSINVDEESNEEIAESFEASGTALFLNVVIDGEETHIDLTEFAFLKAMDKELFAGELAERIEIELEKL